MKQPGLIRPATVKGLLLNIRIEVQAASRTSGEGGNRLPPNSRRLILDFL